ncbi:prominin-2 [Grus japonensis]|uniref:Prominin-2 n=1 Tax=Grus japonensis TaxID=30415 RepID=A0ABC9YEB7_GRUJA
MGETPLMSINARRMEASITAPVPESLRRLPQERVKKTLATMAPLEAELPVQAQHILQQLFLCQPGHWACRGMAFEKGHFTWSCSLSRAR